MDCRSLDAKSHKCVGPACVTSYWKGGGPCLASWGHGFELHGEDVALLGCIGDGWRAQPTPPLACVSSRCFFWLCFSFWRLTRGLKPAFLDGCHLKPVKLTLVVPLTKSISWSVEVKVGGSIWVWWSPSRSGKCWPGRASEVGCGSKF